MDDSTTHHGHLNSMVLAKTDHTSADPPAFKHDPLDRSTRSIRLLRVIRSYESLIRCELLNFDMDTCPPYVALSYIWGEQDSNLKVIECNGMPILVRDNLWDFLYRYRPRVRPGDQVNYIWIDALCINQEDEPERNHQVALMRDIYSTASSVIVWLGEDMGSTAMASDFFPDSEDSFARLMVDEGHSISESQWNALLDLLTKPYWRRVWVVQEFVLANTISMWCGGLVFKVSGFEQLMHQLQHLDQHIFSVFSRIRASPGWTMFKYRGFWRNQQGRESHFQLRRLLSSFSESQSSDVRDKIYGLLGIVAVEVGEHPIEAIYSKSPAEVMVDTMRSQGCDKAGKMAEEDTVALIQLLLKLLDVSFDQLVAALLQHGLDVYQSSRLSVLEFEEYLPATSESLSQSIQTSLLLTSARGLIPYWYRTEELYQLGPKRRKNRIGTLRHLQDATQNSWGILSTYSEWHDSLTTKIHATLPLNYLCTISHSQCTELRALGCLSRMIGPMGIHGPGVIVGRKSIEDRVNSLIRDPSQSKLRRKAYPDISQKFHGNYFKRANWLTRLNATVVHDYRIDKDGCRAEVAECGGDCAWDKGGVNESGRNLQRPWRYSKCGWSEIIEDCFVGSDGWIGVKDSSGGDLRPHDCVFALPQGLAAKFLEALILRYNKDNKTWDLVSTTAVYQPSTAETINWLDPLTGEVLGKTQGINLSSQAPHSEADGLYPPEICHALALSCELDDLTLFDEGRYVNHQYSVCAIESKVLPEDPVPEVK